MWNAIRQPPLIGQDASGRRVGLIFPSFQQQFRVESWLVALIYGASTFILLALIYLVPEVDDSQTQTAILVTCLFSFTLFLSILSLAFRLKGTGYPFGFFF